MIKFVCVTILVIILMFIIHKRKRKQTASYVVPDQIKNTYKKITISTDKLKVLTREYYEDVQEEYFPITSSLLDSLQNNSSLNKVLKHVSVLSYDNFNFQGTQRVLNSTPIYMPEIILKKKLHERNNIDIYFLEDDILRTYFDLSFLR